jgi:predicted SAM-dependent methyltransferase
MLSRNLKAAYYAMFSFPMRANGLRHRLLPRMSSDKVHLGPGKDKYLNGWVNVDANFVTAKIDIWADIRGTLPFKSDSLSAIYSHHVIEHLPDRNLPFHFAEMFRVLRAGGVIRLGGPNADMAIDKFKANDFEWISDLPDKRNSNGGRLANILSSRGEHLVILTSTYLTELASNAGFSQIRFCQPMQETSTPAVFDHQVLSKEWDSTPEFPHTLIIEAQKPVAILRG